MEKATAANKKTIKKALSSLYNRCAVKYTFGSLSWFFSLLLLLNWFWWLDGYMHVAIMVVLASVLLVVGTGLFLSAEGNRKLRTRMNHYLALLTERPYLSLDELGSAIDVSPRKVKRDFKQLFKMGRLEGAYFSDSGRHVVLPGGQGYDVPLYEEPAPEQKQPEPPKQEVKEEATDTRLTLRQISLLGERIQKQSVRDQIARIERTAEHIFTAVDDRPAKRHQIRTFLNYYLPTTFKILEAYARYEAQRVRGQNVTSAAANIEGILEKLADGFERQLDKLYADEVIDIAAEIDALEAMLAKDGLSGEMGLTLRAK